MVFQITKNTIKVHYSENSERLLSAKSGHSDSLRKSHPLQQILISGIAMQGFEHGIYFKPGQLGIVGIICLFQPEERFFYHTNPV
jgi:hypothetical protein